MNSFIEEIERLFDSKIISHEEKNDVLTVIYSISKKSILPSNLDKFHFINSRDSFSIEICDSEKINCKTFVKKSSSSYNDYTSDVLLEDYNTIKLTIVKEIQEGIVSVYNFSWFCDYIIKQPLKSITFFFNDFFSKCNNNIILECLYDDVNIQTETIKFVHSHNNIIEKKIEKIRFTRYSQLKDFCSYNCKYLFLPEDFHVINNGNNNNDIIELFNRLELLYCSIFLFDVIEIDDQIKYKLNGYKSIYHNIDFASINISSHEVYFKIYQWVYNEGNLIDKIGLARNILSLNFKKEDMSILESTFEAVLSSYKIYQKQNIKQYIEIRNKISDQLFEIQNKADKFVDNFIDSYKKSIFIVLSFFISVVVIRAISNANIAKGFNFEVIMLSYSLIIVSIIVMFYNRWEIKEQLERYTLFYNNLKERYKDLLEDSDIKRILNNDKDFNDNITFIIRKRRKYTYVWVLSAIVLSIGITIIYISNNNWTFVLPS